MDCLISTLRRAPWQGNLKGEPESYDKEWARMPPWRGPPKHEEEDGYPYLTLMKGLGRRTKKCVMI